MRLHQRFPHEGVVFRVAVLDQRPLHGFFVGVGGDVDPLHGAGVKAGAVHDGGQRGGGGVKVLHLLRIVAHVPDVLGQLYGLLECRAGMAGHEVGDEILIHAVLPVQGKIFLHKLIIHRVPGLAHPGENRVGHMLRGDFQLTGNVVLHQLPEKGVLFVRQQIVEADAAADEHLFDAGELPQLAKQCDIVRVVGVHILAGGGVKALPPAAGTLTQLLFTGRVAEICGGAADVVDVALEIPVLHHDFRFPEDGLMASGLDDPPLMEGQGAEGAGAEAPPVGHQTELDFLNGGDAPRLFIAGVIGTHVGKVVYRVHFRCGQGLLGRILHHEEIVVRLRQPLGDEGVAVGVLDFEALGVSAPVGLDLGKGGQGDSGQTVVRRFGFEHRAVDVGDVLHVQPGIQGVGHLHDGLFPHAVHEQVGLTVQ